MHRRCAADKSRVTINKRDVFNAGTNDGRCLVKSASSRVFPPWALSPRKAVLLAKLGHSDPSIPAAGSPRVSRRCERIAGSSPASAIVSPGISDHIQDGPWRDCRILVSRRSRVIAQFSLLMLNLDGLVSSGARAGNIVYVTSLSLLFFLPVSFFSLPSALFFFFLPSRVRQQLC